MSVIKKVKIKPLSKKGTDFLYHLVYWPVWLFFNMFMPVRIVGKQNIPNESCVLVSNHSSNSDPLMAIFACGFHKPLRIMAKEELFHIPVLGWFLIKVGMFGVRRGEMDMLAIKHSLQVLKEGSRLLIFPEGTRVTAEIADAGAKTGAIMFSHRSSCKVVPMYIQRKKRWFHINRVIVGEPYEPALPVGRCKPEDYHAAAEDMLKKIYALGANVE